MTDFKNIAKAKQANNKTKLFEASLSRIWQHVQDADNKSFAIITSWRQAYPKKRNIEEFGALKKGIRNLGLGFIVVQGHWQECQDPNMAYVDCPKDQLVDAAEPSLFIPGISQKNAKRLADSYKQDAIVYAGPETKGRVSILFNDGSTQDIGEFKPQTMGQAFTELRKSKEGRSARYFKFEGVEYRAQNYIESLIEEEIKNIFNEGLNEMRKVVIMRGASGS